MTAAPAAVRLQGVSKHYEEGGKLHPVLISLDAEFAQGRFTVILGRSGSGKSTLLNLISGVDVPDAGAVYVQGVEMGALSERDRTIFRRDRIGVVYQFFNLIPTLTVLENVMLGLELGGRPRREAARRSESFLEAVGLADRASAMPDRLSGGEQQRVAIARALAHDPDLILADEPTGNLDDHTGQEVLDLLLDLARSAGRTLVVATHSADVLAVADAAFTIHEGRLAPVATTT